MGETDEIGAGEQDAQLDALLREAARTDEYRRLEPVLALRPGHELAAGRLRIERQIGAGAMGIVYQAFDAERGRLVALKTLRRIEPSTIYRFKNEFRMLCDVVDRNLVRLHELFVEDERWFFSMELVQGVGFTRYVRPGRELDVTRLQHASAQLARAIGVIHAAGKLHRDLKPNNVLVEPSGRVVVLDFGLVVDAAPGGVGQTVTEDGESGTPAYMAPEQWLHGQTSELSDWYGFGVMLYEALTGRLPFEGSRAQLWRAKEAGSVVDPRACARGVPAGASELCLSLLRADPRERAGRREVERVFPSPEPRRSPIELRAPALFGREAELRVLEDAYRSTVARTAPVVVMISGESGMGKSALVEHFLDGLRRGGEALVLDGRCYEREAVPYKALDGVVDTLSRHLRALPDADAAALVPRDAHALGRLFPVLNRVPAIAAAPAREINNARELQRRAFHAFGELLTRARDRRPVVIYVDDLHWGDSDSFSLLTTLASAQEPDPILVITCHRSEEAHAPLLADFVRTLERNARIQVRPLELGPLAPRAAAQLALALLPETGAGPAIQRVQNIAAEAQGSPFFVLELARFQRDRTVPASRSLREVLAERIAALTPPARRMLQLVSIAAVSLDRRSLLDAAQFPNPDEALELLRGEQLVRATGSGSIAPYHDRIREGVSAALEPDEERALHLALAGALRRAEPPQLEPIAHHLRAAGHAAEAAGYAAQAARLAVQTLAFERGVRLYTQALDDGDYDREARAELRVARGGALENAGRLPDAAEDYLAALEHVDDAQAFELRVRAAGALMRSGRIDRGQEVLAPTLARYGLQPARSNLRARGQIISSDVRLRLGGSRAPNERSTPMPPELRRRIDIAWTCVRGITMVDQLRGLGYAYRTTLLAHGAGDLRSYALASCCVGSYLTNLGDAERGRRLVRNARALALRHGDIYVKAFTLVLEGVTDYFCGDYPESLERLDDGQRVLREQCTGVHWEVALAEAFVGWGLYRTGRFRELNQRVPVATMEGRRAGDLYLEVTLSTGPASIGWLVEDDTDTVEQAHRSARARWPSTRPDLQRCLFHEGETYLELYRGEGTARLAELAEEWKELREAPALRSKTLRSVMLKQRVGTMLALAKAQPGRRREYLAEAMDCARVLARSDHPAARCKAGLARAAIACAHGELEPALAALEYAREAARMTNQTMFAVAATRRLGELRGGDQGRTLIEEADAAMRAEGVVRPDRIAAMLAPGCEISA